MLVTFFGVVGMGYEAMVPAYTRRIVRAGVGGYSILLACSGVGATPGRSSSPRWAACGARSGGRSVGMLMFAGSWPAAALAAGVAAGDRGRLGLRLSVGVGAACSGRASARWSSMPRR